MVRCQVLLPACVTGHCRHIQPGQVCAGEPAGGVLPGVCMRASRVHGGLGYGSCKVWVQRSIGLVPCCMPLSWCWQQLSAARKACGMQQQALSAEHNMLPLRREMAVSWWVWSTSPCAAHMPCVCLLQCDTALQRCVTCVTSTGQGTSTPTCDLPGSVVCSQVLAHSPLRGEPSRLVEWFPAVPSSALCRLLNPVLFVPLCVWCVPCHGSSAGRERAVTAMLSHAWLPYLCPLGLFLTNKLCIRLPACSSVGCYAAWSGLSSAAGNPLEGVPGLPRLRLRLRHFGVSQRISDACRLVSLL
jgi:hypothetical protein